MALPEMTGEKLCRDAFQDLLAQELIKAIDDMSKFENTSSHKLFCHKQKVVKVSTLLEDEYLEKFETLEITQSRATATEIAESPLLLRHAWKITSLVSQTNTYLD